MEFFFPLISHSLGMSYFLSLFIPLLLKDNSICITFQGSSSGEVVLLGSADDVSVDIVGVSLWLVAMHNC